MQLFLFTLKLCNFDLFLNAFNISRIVSSYNKTAIMKLFNRDNTILADLVTVHQKPVLHPSKQKQYYHYVLDNDNQ